MQKEKRSLKEFVKDHKKEIIFGSLCVVGGVYIGQKRCGLSKSEKALIKNLRNTDPIFKGARLSNDLNTMFKGSNLIYVLSPTETKTVHDIAERIKNVYGDKGSEIETLGAVLFTK